MSITWGRARDAVKMFETAVRGYEVLNGLVKAGDASGLNVLGSVKQILKSMHDGFSGATSPEVILAELEALHSQIVANNDAIDSKLREKFDHSDGG